MLSDHCLSCLSCLSVCLSVFDVGVLWPNCWMDQDETGREGRTRPRRHCVRWGPSSPSPKGHSCTHTFRLLWPNGLMDQDAIGPGYIVLDWEPGGAQPRPNFRPMYVVAKQLDGSRCHLVYGGRRRSRRHCVRWGTQLSLKGHSPPPHFSVDVYCGQTVAYLSYC